jgi:hypothetical protein
VYGKSGKVLAPFQLSADADVERQHYAGRAEHVSSGQVAHFETLAELLKFFVEVLESEATGG